MSKVLSMVGLPIQSTKTDWLGFNGTFSTKYKVLPDINTL